MNRDQFRGATRHLKGRAQTALGGLTGDPARQVRGAVDQVAGGARYAYGTARDRAEDFVDDGRRVAREAREHAGDLIDDGRTFAREVRGRAAMQGRRAVGYADSNRTTTLLALAGVAFAVGWLARTPR